MNSSPTFEMATDQPFGWTKEKPFFILALLQVHLYFLVSQSSLLLAYIQATLERYIFNWEIYKKNKKKSSIGLERKKKKRGDKLFPFIQKVPVRLLLLCHPLMTHIGFLVSQESGKINEFTLIFFFLKSFLLYIVPDYDTKY